MRGFSAAALLSAGCAQPAQPIPDTGDPIVTVLDMSAFLPVPAERDPLASHRPPEVDCPAAAWGPEGGGFEVQTGVCNYATFDQPLPTIARAGDTLQILLWHDQLDAAEPGVGHVAVWLDKDVLWETSVDIPTAFNVFEASVPLVHTPSPEARLGIHLHNHGFNSWRFVSIDLHSR